MDGAAARQHVNRNHIYFSQVMLSIKFHLFPCLSLSLYAQSTKSFKQLRCINLFYRNCSVLNFTDAITKFYCR